MSKAERLINLVAYLLETPRPVTAQEIRETIPGYQQESLGAFQRMFERDKEELKEMGIPVEVASTDSWEIESGYRILKERYYLPNLDLSKDEILALWLAAGVLRLADPGQARSALLKVSPDLPPEDDRSRLGWLAADLALGVPGLETAFEAVSERRGVTFSYPSREEGSRVRKVDPYGLVHSRGAWYLVGYDHDREEVRSFRLNRVLGELRLSDPGTTGPEFEVPGGFRAASVLERPPFVGEGVGATARVRFDASVAWRVERNFPWVMLEWSSDGSAEAGIEVADENGFLSWILLFGEGAELLAPGDLRDRLRRRLEEICA